MDQITRRGTLGIGRRGSRPSPAARRPRLAPRSRSPTSSRRSTPIEQGATLRVLRPAKYRRSRRDVLPPEHPEIHHGDRHARARRLRGLGGPPPADGGGRATGAGPDIVLGWSDDPHLYTDKILELTELADYLGKKYGGWEFLAAEIRQEVEHRHLDRDAVRRLGRAARLSQVLGQGGRLRRDPERPRQVPRALPRSLRRTATRPASRSATRWATRTATATGCSGRMAATWWTRTGGRDQPARDDRGAEIRQGALPDLHPRRAVLAGPEQQQGLHRRGDQPHQNGVSIYFVLKSDPKTAKIAEDVEHAPMPFGLAGRAPRDRARHQLDGVQAHEIPNAAKEYSAS